MLRQISAEFHPARRRRKRRYRDRRLKFSNGSTAMLLSGIAVCAMLSWICQRDWLL